MNNKYAFLSPKISNKNKYTNITNYENNIELNKVYYNNLNKSKKKDKFINDKIFMTFNNNNNNNTNIQRKNNILNDKNKLKEREIKNINIKNENLIEDNEELDNYILIKKNKNLEKLLDDNIVLINKYKDIINKLNKENISLKDN